MTCFRTGKNRKTILPKTEKNRLPPAEFVGEQIQIDFAGPFVNEKGKKKFIALAVDKNTRWPFAMVCKSCNAESAMKLTAIVCENLGLPRKIRADNAKAFKSKKCRRFLSAKRNSVGILDTICTHSNRNSRTPHKNARIIRKTVPIRK